MRRFHLSPDAGSGSAAGSGGSQVASGSEGSPAAEKPTPDVSKLPGQNKTLEQLQKENEFIRPETLRGILAARERSDKQTFDEFRKSLMDELAGVKKTLEETRSRQPETAKKDGTIEDQEKIELKRRIKESEEATAKVLKELDTARSRERKNRRETAIKSALVRQGCMNPDYVYRMIDPDLQESEDGAKLFSVVQSEFGKEEVTVDDYIKRVVAKDQIPQLFTSSVKQGAPAGGDSAGSGKFKFRASQLKDSEFYMKNIDAIRSAIENKEVDWKN